MDNRIETLKQEILDKLGQMTSLDELDKLRVEFLGKKGKVTALLKGMKDLNNEENNWVTEPEDLDNIRSYLIVPSYENYTLKSKEVIKFIFDFSLTFS